MNASVVSSESLFEIYQRRRAELIAVARRQHEVLAVLAIDETQAEGTRPGALVAELIKRLDSERLRVLVVGRFSAGKSTFINALLGQAVLPSSPVPTTGVLCEVRYADEARKRATLFPKPGMSPRGGSDPFDVTIVDLRKELEQYVRIDHRQAETTSRYQKLELHWPLALCQHGVDLIDTVGLDDPDSRDRVTIEQAATADAVLYCMKSHDAYSAKDKQVIGFLQSLGYRSIFFVITHWDHVRESAALGEMTEEEFAADQRRNLAPWTELEDGGVMFVDSKSALLGRVHGDSVRVAGSGIEAVEKGLQRFLTEEKGRAKLLTSLWTLRGVNRMARTAIPTRIALWQTGAAELERRYREAEVPLQTLETQRQLMVAKVEGTAKDVAREARDLAGRHFLELPDQVRGWAEAYEPKTKIGFPPTKKNVQPVVEEIGRHLKELTEEEIARWTQRVLVPLVEARLQQLSDSLEPVAREFVERIDQLRIQVAVGVDATRVQQPQVSVLTRILAGAYTLATGDLLTGSLGVFLGGKAFATALTLKIAAVAALILFHVLNPVTFVLASIAAILTSSAANVIQLKGAIKKKVGEALAADLVNRRLELAGAIEEKVAERLSDVARALDAGLAGEIASVRGEVEAILAAKQRGQADADAEIRQLRALDEANLAVEERIDGLMEEAGGWRGR